VSNVEKCSGYKKYVDSSGRQRTELYCLTMAGRMILTVYYKIMKAKDPNFVDQFYL
jgi:hypothetical protein